MLDYITTVSRYTCIVVTGSNAGGPFAALVGANMISLFCGGFSFKRTRVPHHCISGGSLDNHWVYRVQIVFFLIC